MTKRKKISIISILCVIFVLFGAIMFYYFGASYPKFYAVARKEFAIPGLDTTFVPQGLTYIKSENKFVVCGYMSDGSASRIYLIDNNENKLEKYVTLTIDGSAYVGHSGGIAHYGNTMFLVGDKTMHRFSLSDFLACENGNAVAVVDSYVTGNGADFVHTDDNFIYVGEFYKKDKYETPEHHKIQTVNGENRAVTYVYEIDETKEFGLKSQTPIKAISMPNQVQGMTFNKNNDIILSTSYSIPSSKIYTYKNELNSSALKQIEINGALVDLFVLDDSNLISTLIAPSMSEEIVTVDDRVYVLFESNCKKYRLFNRTRISNVYSLDI